MLENKNHQSNSANNPSMLRPGDLSELNDPILSLEAVRKWAARESFNEFQPRLEDGLFKADALNIDAFVEEINNIERLFILRKPDVPQGAAYRDYLVAEEAINARETILRLSLWMVPESMYMRMLKTSSIIRKSS